MFIPSFKLNNYPTNLFQHQQQLINNNYIRTYSTTNTNNTLTHVNNEGKASMVNVTPKPITVRKATAQATVRINNELVQLIRENSIKKGDVLSIAQIAGILGAKKTSDIIPLCHNIALTSIKLDAQLLDNDAVIMIQATVQCEGKTGVEMEALTAVTVAALTVYDMCKAVSREIHITNVHLVEKSNGTGPDYKANHNETVVRAYNTKPIDIKETVFVGGV